MTKKVNGARNWGNYNKSLINRGNINLWLDENSIKSWHTKQSYPKKGRPQKYSDQAITCALMLKAIFKLTFRTTQGFIRSLISSLNLDIVAPDYTLLCKRQKTISVNIGASKYRNSNEALHLAVNAISQNIETFVLTDLGTQDCEAFPILLDQIVLPIEDAIGDGAYDRFSCYEESDKRNIKLITPPQKNARTSDERPRNRKKASKSAISKRDDTIKRVRELGRDKWKEETGYHVRSLAETAMFRIKQLFGDKLSSRIMENQIVEAAIRCSVLNKFNSLTIQLENPLY